jgi:hypothetical protein
MGRLRTDGACTYGACTRAQIILHACVGANMVLFNELCIHALQVVDCIRLPPFGTRPTAKPGPTAKPLPTATPVPTSLPSKRLSGRKAAQPAAVVAQPAAVAAQPAAEAAQPAAVAAQPAAAAAGAPATSARNVQANDPPASKRTMAAATRDYTATPLLELRKEAYISLPTGFAALSLEQ